MPTTRETSRAPAVIAAAALSLLATGCNDDDSALRSSNRGSGSLGETTTVENAYIVPAFVAGRCAIQLNAGAALRFTATNNRDADSERLLGLSTSAAERAHLAGPAEIAPKSTVGFGQPSTGQTDAQKTEPAARLNGLDPGLRPAMTADVTFQFERAGDITMPVPVEACPTQQP